MQAIDKKSGRQSKNTYILFVKFMHIFLAKHVNLSFVLIMILNRVPSKMSI